MNAFTEEQIDAMLERILRAAGSSLRHYMPSSKVRMREAMRGVVFDVVKTATTAEANRADALIAASNTGGHHG